MAEIDDLAASIAATTADFRAAERDPPTPEHVLTWVHQFPDDSRLPMLRELASVLKCTYVSQTRQTKFLTMLARGVKSKTPRDFWTSHNFLEIQQKGLSQELLLNELDSIVQAQHGFALNECKAPEGPFVYVDDILFTGGHVGGDLARWIREEAPPKSKIQVYTMIRHLLGEFEVKRRLHEAAFNEGKSVEIEIISAQAIENRRAYRKDADVLWPTHLPENQAVQDYVASQERFPFEPRTAGGLTTVFATEPGRSTLEQEFLTAGVQIRETQDDAPDHWRPLGLSRYGIGFGSMHVTHRNCPNNAPLALWWGVGGWEPLFDRKPNEATGE
jgi:hypothetical protein